MKLKKIIIFVFVLAALAVAAFFGWQYYTQKVVDDTIASSASAGGNWFVNYKGDTGDPALLWMVKEMNKNYCGSDPEIEKMAAKRSLEFQSTVLGRAFLRLLGGNGEMPEESTIARFISFDDIMLRALYCDKRELPEHTYARIFDVDDATGYDLTHRLWAMQMLKERSCAIPSGYDLETSMREAAERLAQQQETDITSTDLYAERVAFLDHMGFGNLIKPEWYQNILNLQKEDGSWSDPLIWDNESNPHTTMLAVWALAQYTETCPFE